AEEYAVADCDVGIGRADRGSLIVETAMIDRDRVRGAETCAVVPEFAVAHGDLRASDIDSAAAVIEVAEEATVDIDLCRSADLIDSEVSSEAGKAQSLQIDDPAGCIQKKTVISRHGDAGIHAQQHDHRHALGDRRRTVAL